MMTKAYVIGKDTAESNKYLVNIPILNPSEVNLTVESTITASATVSCLPGVTEPVHTGDCVFVTFEDNDLKKPIIVGHLFADINSTPVSISVENLIVNHSADLPESSTIGDLDQTSFSLLKGLETDFGSILSSYLEVSDGVLKIKT